MKGVALERDTPRTAPARLLLFRLVRGAGAVLLHVLVVNACTKNNPKELYPIDHDNYRTRRHATCIKHG